MRQRAHDVEGRGEARDGDPAFEQGSQPLHEGGGPLGEVGEGAFLDFAGVAIGFTQEHGGGDWRLGADSMYMTTDSSLI